MGPGDAHGWQHNTPDHVAVVDGRVLVWVGLDGRVTDASFRPDGPCQAREWALSGYCRNDFMTISCRGPIR